MLLDYIKENYTLDITALRIIENAIDWIHTNYEGRHGEITGDGVEFFMSVVGDAIGMDYEEVWVNYSDYYKED